MKERQIPFNGPMVRALLDGSKTKNRWAVKLPHQNPLGSWEPFDWGGPNGGRTAQGETVPFQQVIAHTRTGEIISCPYGQPGDQLWVRERHRLLDCGEIDYFADGAEVWGRMQDHIRLDGAAKWISSTRMPRWASRITLEIVSVRVERLQDVNSEDALREGVERHDKHDLIWMGPSKDDLVPHYVAEYRKIWESINGPGSWNANPWVWAVEFKRITP